MGPGSDLGAFDAAWLLIVWGKLHNSFVIEIPYIFPPQ